jgi:hypothetical protein
MVVHVYNPSYSVGEGKKIWSNWPRQNKRPCLKKKQKQKNPKSKRTGGCGSNGRGLVQVQSPEFKYPVLPKEKKMSFLNDYLVYEF